VPGFVGLDRAGERTFAVVGHELVADQVEHAPCGLVRHAKLTLQLLGRDPASSASHEIHGVEPQVQRRGRLVKDRPGQRIDVVAAVVAVVGRASLHAMEAALAVALLAKRCVTVRGEPLTPKPIEAGSVIAELLDELHEGVRRFGRRAALRCVAIHLCHA
jgi:hypothetical protein